MMEWVLLAVLVVNVAFLAWVQSRALAEIRESHRAALRDKASLIALVREAQNRIHAQSLQGFLALQAQDEPARSFSRSDADEARIAAARNGNGGIG